MSITIKQYEAVCDVIDAVKMDDTQLDTDEYASAILEALGTSLARDCAPALIEDFDPAPDGWEDYALACDARHAANPHRFEGEL